MKPAILLLSGGLDSATCLALAKKQGFEVHALSFAYGQRHQVELEAAKRVARMLGAASHRIANIDLGVFGGSALTDKALDVPKDRSDFDLSHGVPITYVPARNTVFLSYALSLAEVLGASDIFIGVNALDYSGYPDCRREFIEAYETMANLATKAGSEGKRLTIHAPLIDLTKAEIITLGNSLGVDYAATISCYDPDENGHACGHCDSCQLRKRGFSQAGIPDPTIYVSGV
jgi:7-cyano-7-deazaguanine synthase